MPRWLRACVIHTGVDIDGNQSFLEDVQPSSSITDFILAPGASFTFTDAVQPVTLTTVSFDGSGAVLNVALSCSYSLASSAQLFGPSAGTGNVGLSAGADCPWTAVSRDSWITLDPASTSGIGTSSIQFSVASNTSGLTRTGTLTIAGQNIHGHADGVAAGDYEPDADVGAGGDGGDHRRGELRRDEGHQHGRVQWHAGDAEQLERHEHYRAGADRRDDRSRRGDGGRSGQLRCAVHGHGVGDRRVGGVRRGGAECEWRVGGERVDVELEPHGHDQRIESAADGRRRGGRRVRMPGSRSPPRITGCR